MMTPRLFTQIFIIALSVFIFSSCKDNSTGPVVTPSVLHGVYVSIENPHVGGSDYCFLDLDKDTVFNNVFENANGSAFIDGPGKIVIIGQNLYMVCAGPPTQGGKIYEVSISNNHLIKSQAFGNGPRSFDVDNGNIFASSAGGGYITQLDLGLHVLADFVDVGYTPGKVSYTSGKFFVCKSPTALDKALAIVNETSLLVNQVSYNFLPIAFVNNPSGYYLAGIARKYVYRLDPATYNPVDSIVLSTTGNSVVDMAKEGDTKLLVTVDSSEVWEVNLASNPPTSKILIQSPGGRFKITAVGYEAMTSRIYLLDNDGGPPYFGIVRVYDPATGAQLKFYSTLGRNPNSMAFKY